MAPKKNSSVPAGHHRVRSYVRRNPTAGAAKKTSGWVIAAVVAVGAFLWVKGGGDASGGTTAPATTPPTATAPAAP